jgi:5-methylcytosine-specific restriction protein B
MNFPNQPFVLIIDEINRGNISRIFGELITLIEADKRIGERNETFLTLPYSCESFCLPSNLSIIGTMNTADRSIAVLDTALRRRFEFRRMNPDSKVLSQGFGKMLEEFNKELIEEYGLSFDQQIGHAWFMNINKKPKNSQDNDIDVTLESIFMNKILPLLEEWFYGEESEAKANCIYFLQRLSR